MRWGAELGDPRFREAGPARLYDGERVCPPRPIGRWRNARSETQPQAAHGSREARDIPRIRETIGRRATQAPEQRVPQGFVVRRGIRCGLGVIGSGSRAHGQQQPRALQIRDAGQHVKEHALRRYAVLGRHATRTNLLWLPEQGLTVWSMP